MPIIAGDVMQEAASRLNDPNQTSFTTTVLLPFLKIAYRELRDRLTLAGIPIVDKQTSSPIVISAGSTSVSSAPSDMIEPVELHERTTGSSEIWIPMMERSWEPDEPQSNILRYWIWREQTVYLLGATVSREIRVRYKKDITQLVDTNSAIAVVNGFSFLATRTASLAAGDIGEDREREQDLNNQAQSHLAILIGEDIKKNQALPVRRRAYNAKRRRF